MKDKAAIIEAARKFAAKGQIDKAIAEMEKLLSEGKDGNIYNTVGDLYLKKGAQKEAVEAFTKAAEIYREDGFSPKAMALYKKILNILPADADTLTALAVLNAEKGLTANAVENFIRAAEIHNRNGDTEKALDLYEKVLHISPFDVNIRLKTTELYLKMGLKERAANGYTSIASDFMGKGDANKAHEYYYKAIEIDPQNISTLIGFSKLAEKANNTDKALEYLAQAVSFAPDNKSLSLSYANLAVKAGRKEDAKNTLLKLIEKDPSDTQSKKLLGILYLEEGGLEKAWKELLPCIEESVREQDWAEAVGLLSNFKKLYPIPVRERVINIFRSKGDKQALLDWLKELAGLYEETGSNHEAFQLYREASELDPHDTVIKNKMGALENILSSKARPKSEAVSAYEADTAAKELEALKTAVARTGKAVTESFSAGLTAPAPKTGDIFSGLDKGSEEDYESHYVSGVDYRRRGLFDDAVREFQIAAGDPEKTLLSLRMIALCYMEKKAYPLAIAEFGKLLEKMPARDERYLDIKYELADAYSNNNDHAKALELYSEIQAMNPGFRDVAQKINALRAQTQRAGDKPKRDRVSYI
ncbi:MAG: tetratricopeptide repeat protein [Nitrospirae bacterium]|nr:tetratricopeptide repeat protein [Nitrospirota bacterium]